MPVPDGVPEPVRLRLRAMPASVRRSGDALLPAGPPAVLAALSGARKRCLSVSHPLPGPRPSHAGVQQLRVGRMPPVAGPHGRRRCLRRIWEAASVHLHLRLCQQEGAGQLVLLLLQADLLHQRAVQQRALHLHQLQSGPRPHLGHVGRWVQHALRSGPVRCVAAILDPRLPLLPQLSTLAAALVAMLPLLVDDHRAIVQRRRFVLLRLAVRAAAGGVELVRPAHNVEWHLGVAKGHGPARPQHGPARQAPTAARRRPEGVGQDVATGRVPGRDAAQQEAHPQLPRRRLPLPRRRQPVAHHYQARAVHWSHGPRRRLPSPAADHVWRSRRQHDADVRSERRRLAARLRPLRLPDGEQHLGHGEHLPHRRLGGRQPDARGRTLCARPGRLHGQRVAHLSGAPGQGRQDSPPGGHRAQLALGGPPPHGIPGQRAGEPVACGDVAGGASGRLDGDAGDRAHSCCAPPRAPGARKLHLLWPPSRTLQRSRLQADAGAHAGADADTGTEADAAAHGDHGAQRWPWLLERVGGAQQPAPFRLGPVRPSRRRRLPPTVWRRCRGRALPDRLPRSHQQQCRPRPSLARRHGHLSDAGRVGGHQPHHQPGDDVGRRRRGTAAVGVAVDGPL
mmetsp:Transcript_17444/g.55762  ORF Transcript_17444/g.55762 Transcript_17444/m.55762 type:complete len:622 (-) Transcript_17444:566-2431(-)